jgi:hypothetical protein
MIFLSGFPIQLFIHLSVPIRLAFFWVSNYISHIVSAFLATGILRLRGVGGQAGWRYLFLLGAIFFRQRDYNSCCSCLFRFAEGLLTLTIGCLSFIMMPVRFIVWG